MVVRGDLADGEALRACLSDGFDAVVHFGAFLMVPESVVNLIRVGQEMRIRIDALDEQFTGTVVSITPYGPTASRTFRRA